MTPAELRVSRRVWCVEWRPIGKGSTWRYLEAHESEWQAERARQEQQQRSDWAETGTTWRVVPYVPESREEQA